MWRPASAGPDGPPEGGHYDCRAMVKNVLCGVAVIALLAGVAAGQSAGKPAMPGLDATVTKVERAATASLRDCPPGSNTVNATTRPGEQFALVTVAFKVAP